MSAAIVSTPEVDTARRICFGLSETARRLGYAGKDDAMGQAQFVLDEAMHDPRKVSDDEYRLAYIVVYALRAMAFPAA